MLKKIMLIACAVASLHVAADTSVKSDQDAGPVKAEAYKTSFGVVKAYTQAAVRIGGESYRITRRTALGETATGPERAVKADTLYLVEGDEVVFATMAKGSDELRYIYRLTE